MYNRVHTLHTNAARDTKTFSIYVEKGAGYEEVKRKGKSTNDFYGQEIVYIYIHCIVLGTYRVRDRIDN